MDKENRLVILETIERPEGERRYPGHMTWAICKCSCGNIVKFPKQFVQSGRIRSCGCLKYEIARDIMVNKAHTSEKYQDKIIMVEYEGQNLDLRQWAKVKDIPYSTLIYRYRVGFRPPDLFDRYVHVKRRKHGARQD